MPPHYRPLPPEAYWHFYALAIGFWWVMVLLYWPFVHRATSGKKLASLKAAALVQFLSTIAEMVVYLALGRLIFEQLFAQTEIAQTMAKIIYHCFIAIVATGISVLVTRKFRAKEVLWQWAGNQLLAVIVFAATAGVEF